MYIHKNVYNTVLIDKINLGLFCLVKLRQVSVVVESRRSTLISRQNTTICSVKYQANVPNLPGRERERKERERERKERERERERERNPFLSVFSDSLSLSLVLFLLGRSNRLLLLHS